MRVLFRARRGVSTAQMECGMGIAARKRERQQYDQAAQEQGSLHLNAHVTPKGLKTLIPA
jgi:hypothetical protein